MLSWLAHRFNRIGDFHYLVALAHCPRLAELQVNDNPVCEVSRSTPRLGASRALHD